MSFRLISALFDDRTIPLESKRESRVSDEGNKCTIIIGRNGAGKSRLLAAIARAFAFFDEEDNIPSARVAIGRRQRREAVLVLTYAAEGKHVRLRVADNRVSSTLVKGGENTLDRRPPLPRRVIATTITPSDKFPAADSIASRRRYVQADMGVDERIYRYLGGKSGPDSISTRQRLSRVVDALVRSVSKSGSARAKLVEVFRLLGYEPRVEVEYAVRVARSTLAELHDLLDYPEQLFDRVRRLRGPIISWRLLEPVAHDEGRKQALREALHFFAGGATRGGLISVGVDLERGNFLIGTEELFRHLQVLELYRIVNLADLRLIRGVSPHSERQISLLDEASSGLPLSITDASSGEQAVLLTLLGIASEIEDNSLVLIDEPEISLHPEWQERIVSLLVFTFAAYRGCHFVIATHSPQVLAHAGDVNAVVVVVENESVGIIEGNELSQRSADFQLATAFRTPGYRNEYLAREALVAMTLASQGDFVSKRFLEVKGILASARIHMHDDDPIAQMIDAVMEAAATVSP